MAELTLVVLVHLVILDEEQLAWEKQEEIVPDAVARALRVTGLPEVRLRGRDGATLVAPLVLGSILWLGDYVRQVLRQVAHGSDALGGAIQVMAESTVPKKGKRKGKR